MASNTGHRRIGRLSRLLGVVLLVSVAAACSRDDSSRQSFAGTWVMKLGERNFIVLTLEAKGDSYVGTLDRPEHFGTSNGTVFSGISSSQTREVIDEATSKDGHLVFVTRKPDDNEDEPTEFDMTLKGPDQASITLPGVPLEPWPFTRADGDSVPTVASDWDPQATYSQAEQAASNLEMQRIYEADQAARQEPGRISRDQWEVISREDAERRKRTHELLAEDQLHTGEDFNRAAFVFQHGDTPNDYLLAHTLALIATAKGDASATWIAAATLDRYLQSVGQRQIYGTQYKRDSDDRATQEPFDPEVIADALRRQLGVPTLAVQQKQLDQWTEQFQSAGEKSE